MSVCNILLVDDHVDVREVTALLLRDCGYSVIETSSGSSALAAFDIDPTIELLMVDFAMPEMSGSEVLERARIKRPGIRAVFITGYANYAELSGKFADEIVLKNPLRRTSSRSRCARRWANPEADPDGLLPTGPSLDC